MCAWKKKMLPHLQGLMQEDKRFQRHMPNVFSELNYKRHNSLYWFRTNSDGETCQEKEATAYTSSLHCSCFFFLVDSLSYTALLHEELQISI
jgi:hypothetical protein